MSKGQVVVLFFVKLWLAAVAAYGLWTWVDATGSTIGLVALIAFVVSVPVAVGGFLWLWLEVRDLRPRRFVPILIAPWILTGSVIGVPYGVKAADGILPVAGQNVEEAQENQEDQESPGQEKEEQNPQEEEEEFDIGQAFIEVALQRARQQDEDPQGEGTPPFTPETFLRGADQFARQMLETGELPIPEEELPGGELPEPGEPPFQQRSVEKLTQRARQLQIDKFHRERKEDPCGWAPVLPDSIGDRLSAPLSAGQDSIAWLAERIRVLRAQNADDFVWVEDLSIEPSEGPFELSVNGLVRNETGRTVNLTEYRLFYLSDEGTRVGEDKCQAGYCFSTKSLRPGYVADLQVGVAGPIPSIASRDTFEVYARYCMAE